MKLGTGSRVLGAAVAYVALTGASPGPHVQLEFDKLTVQADGVPLDRVLEAIGELGNFSVIIIGEDTVSRQMISDDFANLPLEQGLVRVLGRWDYAFVKDKRTGELKEVYILTGGERIQDVPTDPSVPAGRTADRGSVRLQEQPVGAQMTSDVDVASADQELTVQIEAVLRSAEPQESETFELVRMGLQSLNPKVRYTALEVIDLHKVRDRTILEEVRHLSISDPHPEARGKAHEIIRRYGPTSTASPELEDEHRN